MNVHEYQAKELLKEHGIAVPAGHAALSVEEAVAAARQLPGPLPVRVLLASVALLAVVALLFFVVFPAVEPLLPLNDVTVDEAP